MKHHDQEQLGDQQANFAYTFISLFIIQGSQDRHSNGLNLQAGSDSEAMENRCLLACSLWLVQLPLRDGFLKTGFLFKKDS